MWINNKYPQCFKKFIGGISQLYSLVLFCTFNANEKVDDLRQRAVAEDHVPELVLGCVKEQEVSLVVASSSGLGNEVMAIPANMMSHLFASAHLLLLEEVVDGFGVDDDSVGVARLLLSFDGTYDADEFALQVVRTSARASEEDVSIGVELVVFDVHDSSAKNHSSVRQRVAVDDDFLVLRDGLCENYVWDVRSLDDQEHEVVLGIHLENFGNLAVDLDVASEMQVVEDGEDDVLADDDARATTLVGRDDHVPVDWSSHDDVLLSVRDVKD